MTTVTVLQHEPHEPVGVVGEALAARGLAMRTVALYGGASVPDVNEVTALVSLGGDMDTDCKDEHPFLADEVALLAGCVEREVPMLGICLGAQLLAEATGGSVAHGNPELGYVPITRNQAGVADPVLGALPEAAAAFNGHRDQITIGAGANVLASSAASPVQAYRVGERAYGLQFHPEFDARLVAGYIAAPGVVDYLRAGGCDPQVLLAEARRRDVEHRAMGTALADRWVQRVVRRPQD